MIYLKYSLFEMCCWIIFANNSWPVYCSEVQLKIQVVMIQHFHPPVNKTHPLMEALVIQCWNCSSIFTYSYWNGEKNAHPKMHIFRLLGKVGHQSRWPKTHWAARMISIGRLLLGRLNALPLLPSFTYSLLSSAPSSSTGYPSDKLLTVKCCTYGLCSRFWGRLKELTLLLRAAAVLGVPLVGISAGTSERSALIPEQRDSNTKLQ